MANEWDNWKVGDVLECRRQWSTKITVGSKVTITSIGNTGTSPRGMLFGIDTSDGHKTAVGDYGPKDNPSTYFFLVRAPARQWQVGDRFKVKMDDGAYMNGVVRIIPVGNAPFRVENDYGHVWAWDSWEEFCREAEFVDSPSVTLSCQRCHEPNSYAEPNLPGGGYACYSCRKYHGYAVT